MLAVLVLGHGFLALIALAMQGVVEELRRRAMPVLASVGIALGGALFFLRHSDLAWRTISLEPGPAVAAGLGAACAWLLVMLFDRGTGRWEPAALTGVAATGLSLFALNRWSAPALLFWCASSIAIGVSVRQGTRRTHVWATLALSDGLLTGALIWHGLSAGSWELPRPVTGGPFWLLVAAAVLRAGIWPRAAGWGAGDSYVWPLLPAGAFVLCAGIAGRQEPWVALGLLLIALGCLVWLLMRSEMELSLAGAWPVALMLAVLFVVPGAPWQATAAGLLVATSVLLWPVAEGRAQIERGLLVAFVPPSAGFSAIVAAAIASFDRATATTDVMRAIPWTAVTALLPAAVAGGVMLGVRVGRRAEAEHYEVGAVIATWVLFGSVLAAGLWPRILSGEDAAAGRVFVLNLVAVAVGLGAARLGLRPASFAPAEPGRPIRLALLDVPRSAAHIIEVGAGSIAAIAALGALWFVVRGLQVGFL
jgi:hypothetical protein